MKTGIFTEEQRFTQKWVWLLLAGTAGMAWWSFVQQIILGSPFGNRPSPDFVVWIIWALFGVGMPWLFYSLRLVTQVRSDGLLIRFYPFRSRTIFFRDIESFYVRQYHPLREYGGWGIRCSRKNGRAYNVSGNMGVQLELVDGKRILIGSSNPERLAQALRTASGR
jgi:hypothetical protein